MEYKIDKGVEIPAPGRYCKYPFKDMEVVDSFVVSPADRARVSVSATYYGKRNGKRFTVRKDGDVLRCWRVS